MAEISDVTRAVAQQWDTKTLTSLGIAGGLHLDQLPRGSSAQPLMPYAIFKVEQDRRNRFAIRSYTAYTRVTFELFDVNVLGPSLDLIHQAFDWPDNKLDFTFASNVSHKYTQLGDQDEIVTDKERNGQKIRRATIVFIIWTQRLTQKFA